MDGLQEIVRNLALLILFSFFLELLLPNNSFKGYLRVILGLFIIITLLTPVMELLNGEVELRLPVNAEISNNQIEKMLLQGKRLETEQKEKALNLAKKHLEQQVEGMISFTYGVASPKVELILEGKKLQEQKIVQVSVILNLEKESSFSEKIEPIEKVKINPDAASTNSKTKILENKTSGDLVEKIRLGIGAYLNIDTGKINIHIQNG